MQKIVTDNEYEEAFRQIKSDASIKNLLLLVLDYDFTRNAISIIDEDDKCNVELMRGEGRLLMRYMDKLGG